MRDLNEVNLLGRICSDIDIKYTPTGKQVASFSIVTNKSFTGQDGIKKDIATFHNMIAWGKAAELLDQYMKKGSKIFCKGELQTQSWEAQDGTKRYKTMINVRDFAFLDSKKKEENNIEGEELEDNSINFEESDNKYGLGNKKKLEEILIEDIPFN